MSKKAVSILSGAAGILLAGAIYAQVLKFPEYALHATQYAKFLVLVLAVLSAILLITSVLGHEQGKPVWVKSPVFFTVTAVLTLAMVASLKYVGFYVAGVVYMLILAMLLGLRRPLYLLLCTALLLALVYGVFIRFLNVPVPLGVFEEFTWSDITGSLAKAKAAWSLL